MSETGRVQIDPRLGVTYVVNTANAQDYIGSAVGTVFVTFDVESSFLVPSSKPEWSRVVGPEVPAAINFLRNYPIKRLVYPSDVDRATVDDMTSVPTRCLSLEPFESWARQLLESYERAGLAVKLRALTIDRAKNSAGFEIGGESMMCSVRGWDSGEWEVDIVDEAAPSALIAVYAPARSIEEMIECIVGKLRQSGLPI